MSGESMSRGRSGGIGEWGYQPGVYVPLKALFLVLHETNMQINQ